jgi:ankyrin repeat protein
VANDGNTPLGKAAMAGHAAVVRSLCEAGANPNSQGGKKRWSPVHYAAVRSRLEALEIMLEFGADPSLKDSHGKTPLDLVAGRHNEVMVELKRLEPMLKLLGEVTAVLMQDDGAGTHNEREL